MDDLRGLLDNIYSNCSTENYFFYSFTHHFLSRQHGKKIFVTGLERKKKRENQVSFDRINQLFRIDSQSSSCPHRSFFWFQSWVQDTSLHSTYLTKVTLVHNRILIRVLHLLTGQIFVTRRNTEDEEAKPC